MRFHRNPGPARSRLWARALSFSVAFACLLVVRPAGAEINERPPHLVLQAGYYAALGSPAPWGPSLAIDLLPGSLAGRWGLRGEYRGYRGLSRGSILVGAVFEAGASRPQLSLKLVPSIGITADNSPMLGGAIDWSLWFIGPLGVSAVTDVQVIIDGADTRPALSGVLSLHLGH